MRKTARDAIIECIDWVQAEARDCRCAERIEAHLRALLAAEEQQEQDTFNETIRAIEFAPPDEGE